MAEEAFRFVDLPAEIRNEVYSLVISSSTSPFNILTFSTPAISKVSTQLRSEALPLFFAEANFYVNVSTDLKVKYHLAPPSSAFIPANCPC